MDFLRGVVKLADAIHLSNRPPPAAPDGRYDTGVQPEAGMIVRADPHSNLYEVVRWISDRAKDLPFVITEILDPATWDAVAEIKKLTSHNDDDGIDDRTLVFTKVLSVLCRIPEDTPQYKMLNQQVIALLYKTLPHPPAAYIGADHPANSTALATASGLSQTVNRLPFAARSADGSGNNPNMPELGKAGAPYSRSVHSTYPLPPHVLPSPEDVFDSLLKARDFQLHPGGNSSLTFAFASIVTHSLFRTNPFDMTKNNTSSYLDLSVVYGNSQTEQDTVRDKDQGKGLLYPDTFAEDRLLFIPPAASALLVLFSRNHNYIVEMLLKLNERGRWTDPPPEDLKARAQQDEEIFQTARLVNCGNYMTMIFSDYVAGFLGIQREGLTGNMMPFEPFKDGNGIPVGRGEGNHCSVEFNILYRWHATISKEDIAWTEDLFKDKLKGKDPETMTLEDFIKAIVHAVQGDDPTKKPEPRFRTFGGLTRGPDGRFADDDLASLLQDATDKGAGAYRARGSPAVLRLVEILGMVQARKWGLCTMNEFRAYLGLKRFESFEEWNKDSEIAEAARKLYGHIDNLELYPGLQAEETMPLRSASGLCCGYTMSRAILGDAIALVRGDRFYTTDYTPANLTAWGFQDCAHDPQNGAFGAAIPRLLSRHLPRSYPPNNVYSLFSFFTPTETKKNLEKMRILSAYDTARPIARPRPRVLTTIAEIGDVLKDRNTYRVHKSTLFEKTVARLSALSNVSEERQATFMQALFPTPDAVATHATWFGDKVRQLVEENSFALDGVAGKRVNAVDSVVNLAPVYWVSEFILGIVLKTIHKHDGYLTPIEVNDMLQSVFTAVYWEEDWSMERRGSYLAQVLGQFIEKSLLDAVPHFGKAFTGTVPIKSHSSSHKFLQLITPSGAPSDQVVADVVGFAVITAKGLAKSVSQVVDFYLREDRAKEYAEVVRLASLEDDGSRKLLRRYVREAQRTFIPEFTAVFHEEVREPAQGPRQIIALDLKTALTDPKDFPDPLVIDPRRAPESCTVMQHASFSRYLGTGPAEEIVLEMVRAVFQIKDIQCVPGRPGSIGRIVMKKCEVDFDLYTNELGLPGYWPTSLMVKHNSLSSILWTCANETSICAGVRIWILSDCNNSNQ